MSAARRFLAQRHLAVLLCVATLLLKLLVPTGYMIGGEGGGVTIMPCTGVASEPMAMAMPGMHGDMPDHGGKDHGKAEMPCPFASLSAATLGAVDPIQLVAHVAFIIAVGLSAAMSSAITRRGYLRPPLRGPPALR